MLEMRPACERCSYPLPSQSKEAWICTYECTFCATCAHDVHEGVCPNCGGDLTGRPSRPGGERSGHDELGTATEEATTCTRR